MKIVSWNIEHALRRLAELPSIMDPLGSPDVLRPQEVRIRTRDSADIASLEAALLGYRCHTRCRGTRATLPFRAGACTASRPSSAVGGAAWCRRGISRDACVVRKARIAIVNVNAVNGTSKVHYDATRAAGGRPACSHATVPETGPGPRQRTATRRRGHL